MKLTNEQIISAINGCVRTEENEFGLELHRFSKEQEAYLSTTPDLYSNDSFFDGYFKSMCRTCAGITLDFISDAKALKINFGKIENGKSKLERIHMLDLYIDGIFSESFVASKEIVFKSSGERKRFTLYLPYYSFTVISCVELDGATLFLPQKKQVDILFLGDSITHGANAKNPSNSYAMRVARYLDVGILNQGISGYVYDACTVERVCDPRIIVTAYGVNDYFKKNPAKIESDTTQFLEKTKKIYMNSKIVSILPLWTALDAKNKAFKRLERESFLKVYSKYSDLIIDGFDLIPHEERFYSDDIHPNDEGFASMADHVAKALEKTLK